MKVITFESTEEAYDATQCGYSWENECEVETGDILIVESEKVVGISHTWPIAVTELHGELHTLAEGYDIEQVFPEHLLSIYLAKKMAARFDWELN